MGDKSPKSVRRQAGQKQAKAAAAATQKQQTITDRPSSSKKS